MAELAGEKAERILREHHPAYIAERAKRELDRMAVSFQQEAIASKSQ